MIARPPLLFLAALLLGLVLDRLLPWPFAVPGTGLVRWITAGALVLVGLTLAAAGIHNFSQAATPAPTNQPTRVLVTTGIHGWTYGGIGTAAGSLRTLILTLPLAITLRYGVVAREEAYLQRWFGDAYRDYKARVRRWL